MRLSSTSAIPWSSAANMPASSAVFRISMWLEAAAARTTGIWTASARPAAARLDERHGSLAKMRGADPKRHLKGEPVLYCQARRRLSRRVPWCATLDGKLCDDGYH